jgi:hypothetical protein
MFGYLYEEIMEILWLFARKVWEFIGVGDWDLEIVYVRVEFFMVWIRVIVPF